MYAKDLTTAERSREVNEARLSDTCTVGTVVCVRSKTKNPAAVQNTQRRCFSLTSKTLQHSGRGEFERACNETMPRVSTRSFAPVGPGFAENGYGLVINYAAADTKKKSEQTNNRNLFCPSHLQYQGTYITVVRIIFAHFLLVPP